MSDQRINDDLVVVLITAGTQQEAAEISRQLVESRKAACVNIIPGVQSFFRWQDEIESDNEVLLVVKTRSSLLPQLVAMVKEIHSYDLPEVIAIPIIGGSEEYLEWLADETGGR